MKGIEKLKEMMIGKVMFLDIPVGKSTWLMLWNLPTFKTKAILRGLKGTAHYDLC
jgi:hypothetical protein